MKSNLMRVLLMLPVLGLASCSPPARQGGFSSVSEGFDPEASFRGHGYAVKSAPSQGVSNPATLQRWRSWQGVLTIPESTNTCAAVAVVIQEALNRSLGGSCRDELTPRLSLSTVGTSGQLQYQKDGMRGEVHVWLFGGPADTTVNYAILLREERARKIEVRGQGSEVRLADHRTP